MATVYFVTNRNPRPSEKNPTDFGPDFSSKGIDDLRFGKARVTRRGKKWDAKIATARERITTRRSDLRLGSKKIFAELQEGMQNGKDTLVFVHGYNVSFEDALIAGAQLLDRFTNHPMNVIVFTWPSDGSLVMPANLRELYAYKNDRNDARASGPAFARGFLKAADFLKLVTRRNACESRIHLVTHSMGNFVLRHALHEAKKHLTGPLPRLFDEVFLMAADEDYDAFEMDFKYLSLPELAASINVYFNRRDVALSISDKIKFNPARLGLQGPRMPLNVPGNVSRINATEALKAERPNNDRTGHSYFVTSPRVGQDVEKVLAGASPDVIEGRRYVPSLNQYLLT